MFVFKAAVVGAGTMGGADRPDDRRRRHPRRPQGHRRGARRGGPRGGRATSPTGRSRNSSRRGKLTAEQADAQVDEILGRITGTTSYDGLRRRRLRDRGRARADGDQAEPSSPSSTPPRPGHAILASNTSSLSITEIGEATLRPDKVIGFHYFYPASIMPLIEIVEGEDTSAETVTAAVTFAQAIRKQPITCAEVPGFVVNRILNSGDRRDLARAGGEGPLDQEDRRGRRRRRGRADGPYFLVDLLGLDTVLHVAEHLVESYGEERFYVPKGMQKLVADGKLGAKTGGDGFYDAAGRAQHRRATPTPTSRSSSSCSSLKTLLEACLVLEEGVATHRDIDFGMMAGAGLDPRRGLLPPFMKADSEGLDSDPRAHGERGRAPRRALRAADDPAPARRPGPPRPEDRAGLLRLPAARRRAARRGRSSSRRARTASRSRGWPTAR